MPELLFELGCEELPASFVRRAYSQLEREIIQRLDSESISHGLSKALGTARRLIVSVQDVGKQQPDRTKELRGPGVKSAFDASGNPTPALLGFCKAQGVDISELRTEGDYVWITKKIPGAETATLLTEILPDAVRALTFDKAMRWGASRMRFARPIRWLLAAFDGSLIPFSIESVESGIRSKGHRFDGEQWIESTNFADLILALRTSGHVIADPAEREKMIRESSLQVASGSPEMSDSLVDENVFLTEWPTAIEGAFREEFLELPEPVLVTAMAKHERFFPIRDQSGKLTNKFVSIRNGGVDDVVREGNAWVLNARFNDAKFFHDEDQKRTLSEFLEKTSGIIFQEKLGSILQRTTRLSNLASKIAESFGYSAHIVSLAEQAGKYSKADLSSGLVSELASLQGVIGGEYAKREGLDQSICFAIANQYDLGAVLEASGENKQVAICLLCADQIDKLSGYVGIGLIPKGSSDPFALRRAANILIECASHIPESHSGFAAIFNSAEELYQMQGIQFSNTNWLDDIGNIFEGRYDLSFADIRHDIRAAAIAPVKDFQIDDRLNPRIIKLKVYALEKISVSPATVQTATRPLNILTAAIQKNQYSVGIAFDKESLDSESGTALAHAMSTFEIQVREFIKTENANGIAQAVEIIAEPVNIFFDTTMIMAEDAKVRQSRLALLEQLCRALLRVGNFSVLVVEA